MFGRKWTKEEEELLVQMYADPKLFCVDIARRLGRTKQQVYSHARLMGLKAPIERIKVAGTLGSMTTEAKVHRFKKGCVPPNKGKKMSPELYAKAKPTMFKKGNVPANHKRVGSERVNVDGYIEVKVAEPSKWKLKHRVIWEEHFGEIPRHCNIQFRNGNRMDCRIENLYIITRIEQMRDQNSYYAKYPAEFVEVLRLKARVKRQIRKQNKKQNEQK